MPFLTLFAIPTVAGMIAFWVLPGISWKEFLIQLLAQAAIAGLSVWVIYNANTSDTEVLTGRVTDKRRVQVACSHSYPCRCYMACSGVGARRSCSQRCSTCYRHSHDFDWRVFSSLYFEENIARIDSQGVLEPSRWTAVQVGEPFALEHEYRNYIKAAPGSLFKRQGLAEKYEPKIPAYPAVVYDYYRNNALVLVNGAQVDDARAWNQGLAELNSRLGPKKQVHIAVVIARELPHEFFFALEQAWIGGKKNTAALVVGVDRQLVPQWAAVMAWTSNEMVKIHLRDAVMDLPRLDRDLVLPILEHDVAQYYQRKPMSDFDYLRSSIAPTPTQWAIAMGLGLLVCLGLSGLFQRYDVFGDEAAPSPRHRRYER